MKIQDANDMSTVTKHQLKDGTIRYRTQVRVQREGYPDSKVSKTSTKNYGQTNSLSVLKLKLN